MDQLAHWSQEAQELGFDLCGWTHARPLARYRRYLNERFGSGRAVPGERTELRQRLDPAWQLPGASSVWVVAMSYLAPAPLPAPDPAWPALARFTWGRDYHLVLGEKLQQLVWIWTQLRGPFNYRIAVDTGPLLERALAVRAGLGWTGKNACLINPRLGSWLVLGTVITDLQAPRGTAPGALRAGLRGVDPCRGCSRCLKACPTGALRPYQLDGPRCLSHITQSRQPPPAWALPHFSHTVWGCDRCQEVCPWNQGVRPRSESGFAPRSTRRVRPDPDWLAEISDREYRRIYGDSALSYRGPELLRRNARLHLEASAGTR